MPLGYRVLDSGPSGELLQLLGRHSWRAAHIHFKLNADDYVSLTMQVYIDGNSHLDLDTTFTVWTAILKLQKHESSDELKKYNQSRAFYTAKFDFMLKPVTLAANPKVMVEQYVYAANLK